MTSERTYIMSQELIAAPVTPRPLIRSVSAAHTSARRPSSIRAKHVFFAAFGLLTLFVLYRYETAFLDSRSPVWQHFAPVKWLLLPHGIGGSLALFIAPLLFSTRLRQRNLRLHRIMGRLYVAGV